jgi:hypothetical protein
VEIVFRKVNAAAILGDKWFRVLRAATRFVELHSRFAADPNTRNLKPIKFGLKPLKTVKKFAAGRKERVDGAIDDNFCPEQSIASELDLPLYGMKGSASGRPTKKEGGQCRPLSSPEQTGNWVIC